LSEKMMAAPGETAFPSQAWRRWENPDFAPIRQAVLIFGGDIEREVMISRFDEVTLVLPGTDDSALKGSFYLTSARFVFIPGNKLLSPNVVHASYDLIRRLNGVYATTSISIVDTEGATANFKFPAPGILFQSFNLLRLLAGAARLPRARFTSVIARTLTNRALDETPFSALEVDLAEVQRRFTDSEDTPFPESESIRDEMRLLEFLAPVQRFFERCVAFHFDIHFRLWFLFAVSLVSFCLKYIPFYPFLHLCTLLFLSISGWRLLNRTKLGSGTGPVVPDVARGFAATKRFFVDWFLWGNARKSLLMAQICLANVIAWKVFRRDVYIGCSVLLIIAFLARYWTALRENRSLSGYWFAS
jgi:hypothetical protein